MQRFIMLSICLVCCGCGSTTGPLDEEAPECRPAGPLAGLEVNAVKADTSLVQRFELCDIKTTTVQLP